MNKIIYYPHIIEFKNKHLLHCGRNQLWLAEWQNKNIVVKNFKRPLLLGYEYIFRKSKARRSFENAKELLHRGIHTPVPIAYFEKRGRLTNRLIDCSYFCHYEFSEPLITYYTKSDIDFIKSFAAFIGNLHNKGIRHDDLNNTNIRIIHSDKNIEFSLIDLNRMHIYNPDKPVPLSECFDNITRFSTFDNNFKIFVEEYLKFRNLPLSLKNDFFLSKNRHDAKVENKKRLKNLLR